MKCFKDIKEGNPFLKFKIEDENFEEADKLTFDLREKYIAVSTNTQIIFFALNKS